MQRQPIKFQTEKPEKKKNRKEILSSVTRFSFAFRCVLFDSTKSSKQKTEGERENIERGEERGVKAIILAQCWPKQKPIRFVLVSKSNLSFFVSKYYLNKTKNMKKYCNSSLRSIPILFVRSLLISSSVFVFRLSKVNPKLSFEMFEK